MQGTFAGWFSKQSTEHSNSSALILLTLGIQQACVKTWLLFKSTEWDYRVFRAGINICGKKYRIFLRMQNLSVMECGLSPLWCVSVLAVWLQSQENILQKMILLSIFSHLALAKGLLLLFPGCLIVFFSNFWCWTTFIVHTHSVIHASSWTWANLKKQL